MKLKLELNERKKMKKKNVIKKVERKGTTQNLYLWETLIILKSCEIAGVAP